MKTKFYPFLLTAILAVINIFLFYRIINFESKLDTLREAVHKLNENKQPTDKQILISQFKEESYIRQQERDTTLILTVFALFAGFTAFLSFKSFSTKVEEHADLMNTRYIKYEAENREQHGRLIDLESDLNYEMYRLKSMEADKALDDKDLDRYVFYNIFANYHLYHYIVYNKDKGRNDFVESLIKSLIINLKVIDSKINNKIVEMNISYKDGIIYQISKINGLGEHEVFSLFNSIYTKLSFVDDKV